MSKLKIWAIVILGIMLAIFEIFTPSQTEVNYAVYSLFLAVIVVPPALAILRRGISGYLTGSASVMPDNEKAVALVTTGLVLVLLQVFSDAPGVVKLGLASAFGTLILAPSAVSALKALAAPPPKG